MELSNKSLCDIENKRPQKELGRAQNFNFNPYHIAGVRNKIADAVSRHCGIVSKTEHTPDDNLRLLPMSKKTIIYKKEFEIQDPLVERLGDIGGKDAEYKKMLYHIKNRKSLKTYQEIVSTD